MNFYAATALINAITSLSLGLIVFAKNYKNRINIFFFLFAFVASLWCFSYFLWQISITASSALFWSKALMFFAIFIPVTYLHFVFALSGLTKQKKIFIIINYLLFLFFALVDLFTNLFVSHVEPLASFRFWPIAGPAFSFFLIIWFGYVCYASYILYLKQKKSSDIIKKQIKYILLGLIIGFLGGSTNYFLWFRIPIPPVGNSIVFLYVALTAYAIIRHRFLDIRLVIARAIAYFLLVIVIGASYALGLFIFGSIIFPEINNNQLFSVSLALILAFTFQPLRLFLEKITDKLFFKGHYDSQELIKTLSGIMNSTLELEPLTLRILDKVTQNIRVARSVFVLLDKNEEKIEYVEYDEYEKKPEFNIQEVKLFIERGKIAIFDELEEGVVKNMMRELNISAALPLNAREKKIGVLFLGEKSSGDIYSEQDIDVLEILAPQLSVAIQNSREYEEIKRFNITLREEIEKATKELQNANERLKQLDKLKDEFVSIASHELRTPMTAIKSYVWLLLNDKEATFTESQKKYMNITYQSVERLINLVNDMLSVSRIESGRTSIEPSETDYQKLIDDTITEVSPRAKELGINVVIDKKGEVPHVFADINKTKQVLINLIGNSLKFTPKDGTITISFYPQDDTVVTALKDTGVGIKKEDILKLFQKFGIVGNSDYTKQNAQGTGLGLYLSKSIIELQKGKMWAESEGEGKGSTFTFTLPVYNKETHGQSDTDANTQAKPIIAQSINDTSRIAKV